MSAGEIGCPSSEISVTRLDASSSWSQSSSTWRAECRGRRFICTETETLSEPLLLALLSDRYPSRDSQVSCTEELAPRPGLALQARPQTPSVAPPAAGLGFGLGRSRLDAQAACEDSGHAYRESSSGRAACDGVAARLELAGTTHLYFRDDRLTRILLVHEPEESLVRRFVELRDELSRKYGAPSAKRLDVPGRCASGSQLEDCTRDGSAHLRVHWQWPSGQRVSLTAGKPLHRTRGDQPASLRLEYFSPTSATTRNASAL